MSNLAPQNRYSLEFLISPQTSLAFLGFALINVATNLLSNLLTNWSILGLAGIISTFLYWFFLEYRRKRLLERFAVSVSPQAPQPAGGLVLLLSPYSPGRNSKIDITTLQNQIAYIQRTPIEKLVEADFEAIDLLKSNLVPQIKAVEHHWNTGELRDVWLITTKVPGSGLSAGILEQYLRFRYAARLQTHSQSYCVDDWNYKQLCELGEKIFRECHYKQESVVVDITGGTKMMSVALAMACLRPGRRMQYMESHRDWQGNPLEKGKIEPVGIDVSAIVYK
ncbi:MAG: hypothetical protein IGS39_04215 [Calothrix sp. C42_A2020_038]|nr:hypothetical protein [Calothrix sp. C42_A2020_038]